MSITPPIEASTPVAAEGADARAAQKWKIQSLSRYGIVWVTAVVVIVASQLSSGFLTTTNIQNVLVQNAPLALVALGMTFVMIAGGFDLSSGALVGACAVVAANLANTHSTFTAVAIAVLVGAVAGLVNGVLVTLLHINAFVATLATGSIFVGLAFLYGGPQAIFITNDSFNSIGASSVLGVQTVTLIVLTLYVLGQLVLTKTIFGLTLYAVGGNAVSARLAGLRVNEAKAATFVLLGACAGAAGVIFSALITSATPTAGATITLDAITVVIIGGTSMFGGSGAVWRTLVGLVLLATISNVFNLLAVPDSWQSITKGVLLILAVGLDYLARRRN